MSGTQKNFFFWNAIADFYNLHFNHSFFDFELMMTFDTDEFITLVSIFEIYVMKMNGTQKAIFVFRF